MSATHSVPQGDRDLREWVRRAREERGLLPQQLAASIGVGQDDVEFIETHGVAVTPSMLAVLSFLEIEDYDSNQFGKLAQLVPGGRGEVMLTQLVEGGFKSIEAITGASEDALLGLPWFDLRQLGLLREGLKTYWEFERVDDADES